MNTIGAHRKKHKILAFITLLATLTVAADQSVPPFSYFVCVKLAMSTSLDWMLLLDVLKRIVCAGK